MNRENNTNLSAQILVPLRILFLGTLPKKTKPRLPLGVRGLFS